MYEIMTYENILQRMLDRVPGNIGKQEGTLIYSAIAPAAAELAILYMELETAWNEMFADTASRDFLIRRAAERGITPYQATNAILHGVFQPAAATIPPGARFRCNDLVYRAVEKITEGEYRMKCEETGEAGNRTFGELFAIDYIQGLETGELTELLIPGEDEEETEHLRKRYFDSLESQAYGGNIADYKEKVMAIQGVGGIKVYPAWLGGGTVKLVILSSEYQTPGATLVQAVQEAVDPPADSGKGYGIAPIGHHVTVAPVSAAGINLQFLLVYQAGYSFAGVKEVLENAVDAYFFELNQAWADSERLVIRISRLESRILEIEGILDITETRLNGSPQNVILGEDEIAIRGNVGEIGK